MRVSRILVVIALCAAGCGGAQEGKYANSSNREAAVIPHVGLVLIARGAALRSSALVGPEVNLLYVLVVCPGLQGESAGARSNVGRFTSEYSHTWSTSAGDVSFSFSWDRVTDTVHIARGEYARARGNAFVVRRDAATALWSAQQRSNIGSQVNLSEALRQIQSQLSGDPVITSLAIHPEA
jgi:hypothetical protein